MYVVALPQIKQSIWCGNQNSHKHFVKHFRDILPKPWKFPLKTIKNSDNQQLPNANYTYVIWVCLLHLYYSFRWIGYLKLICFFYIVAVDSWVTRYNLRFLLHPVLLQESTVKQLIRIKLPGWKLKTQLISGNKIILHAAMHLKRWLG